MYISIVVPLSRPKNVALVFDNIKSVIKDPQHIYELVLCVDNSKVPNLDQWVEPLRDTLRQVSILNTKNKPPRKLDMTQRRNRIAAVREKSKEWVGGSNFVFSFEDDAILPPFALTHLLDDYNELPDCGFVQGVQVGRWGSPYIGAWHVDDIENPTEYKTTKHVFSHGPDDNPHGLIEEVDAGGFYCYLTPTNLYKAVNYKWQEPVGPDVDFGLQLRKMGYRNYTDYFVECGHRTDKGDLYPGLDATQITLTFHENRWRSKVEKIIPKN